MTDIKAVNIVTEPRYDVLSMPLPCLPGQEQGETFPIGEAYPHVEVKLSRFNTGALVIEVEKINGIVDLLLIPTFRAKLIAHIDGFIITDLLLNQIKNIIIDFLKWMIACGYLFRDSLKNNEWTYYYQREDRE